MKKNINLGLKKVVIGILLLNIFACDTREDIYMRDTTAPGMYIRKWEQNFHNISDSIKIMHDKVYKIATTAIYERHLVDVKIEYDKTKGKLYTGNTLGQLSNDSLQYSVGNTYTYTYKPDSIPGIRYIKFIGEDLYGNKGEAEVKLTVFDNLPPVAKLKIQNAGNLIPKERIIGASASYDKDAKYGGYITHYKYLFSSSVNQLQDSIVTVHPSVRYIFPKSGIYTVQIEVVDNNGASSQTVLETITVN